MEIIYFLIKRNEGFSSESVQLFFFPDIALGLFKGTVLDRR